MDDRCGRKKYNEGIITFRNVFMNDQMIIKKGWHMAFENVQKEPAEIQNYELTTQQMNIWNLQKYYEGTAISNICSVILYADSRDLNRLAQSVRLVVEEQTALRLRFMDTDPVTQYVSDEKLPLRSGIFLTDQKWMLMLIKWRKNPCRLPIAPCAPLPSSVWGPVPGS